MERPDLSSAHPDVVAYIEYLEGRLLAKPAVRPTPSTMESTEPPTTMQLITMSAAGVAKRTARHLYGRQRRGGMGVFDMEVTEADPPAFLAIADEAATLLVWSNRGRVYRLPVSRIPTTEVRGRGVDVSEQLKMLNNERIVALLPEDGGAEVALASERGWVRTIRASFLGSSLMQGMGFHDPNEGGELAAACWLNSGDDLFVVSEGALAIRFAAHQLGGRRGRLGLRLGQADRVLAIAATQAEGGVFLLGADGKGTIRLMSGFRQNKAPGAGGKVALKTDKLIGAGTVSPEDDLFVISAQGKLIRFAAAEVPPKEGVVQGVNCMTLRHDEAAALAVCALPSVP